jgi:glycine/D-amino acid oxidase-like deaminating enzyme
MATRKNKWGRPPWRVAFRPKRSALPERVDFAVIGGGFAGLSAAAYFRRLAPEKSVIVLEAGSLGQGASGRTGGIVLEDTAAGKLPGLGNVLAGYKKVLRDLDIHVELSLPGVWELGRGGAALMDEGGVTRPMKNSPISWNDSGDLRVVRRVPGGTVDPGKVVSGLVRAAQSAGGQIMEHAEVCGIEFTKPLRLRVRLRVGRRLQRKSILAERVLLATNAGALDLTQLRRAGDPKLTFALATVPLTRALIKPLGLSSGRPFYTLDLPYLWGRLLAGNRVIFGSGLVPPFGVHTRRSSARAPGKGIWNDLDRFDIHSGQAAAQLRWLEERIHALHPALKDVRITHRWCGPILITQSFRPIFHRHPKSPRLIVLAGFSGHGVALAVYLGRWAAESLLGLRPLPRWPVA